MVSRSRSVSVPDRSPYASGTGEQQGRDDSFVGYLRIRFVDRWIAVWHPRLGDCGLRSMLGSALSFARGMGFLRGRVPLVRELALLAGAALLASCTVTP